ncbi:MAG TPA: glycosyl hydrolase family 8 [Gaiellales bacterium]|nr:glycosyl hydrolase family 8 [Gaiellales bacterium]
MRVGAVLVLALALSVPGCGGSGPASPSPSAADTFLARHVTGDGRVIRHDQGGDIVSEGQAYAMLLAEAAGRPERVRTIWSWTAAHLRGPDGLFAWHATGSGDVLDPQSATDADVLIAYGLLRYAGPGAPELHAQGRRVAPAVLAREAVALPDGAPLLVAGPWARATSPPTVNPSYLMPGIFAALARLTGDGRWARAASAAVTAVRDLTADGRRLPPDWAVLAGRRLLAAPAPDGGAGVQYGQDAARLPVWFATACDPDARALAGRWWQNVLSSAVPSGGSPLSLMAGAAAATAAGDTEPASQLRHRAAALATRSPTYYGDAWAALGPALLDGAIEPCRRS